MYILANKLDLNALKDCAVCQYKAALINDWGSAGFVDSLRLVYEETKDTDRLLKDLAINAASEHVKELLDESQFVALCKEKGNIAVAVLQATFISDPKSASSVPSTQEASIPHCPIHVFLSCYVEPYSARTSGHKWKCTSSGATFNVE